ncbi:MAG: hypothetical protein IKJ99_04345 [Oscillospiraceae bacterium]|nr:hypothetical protein [Oscillospiraceae bacterium]
MQEAIRLTARKLELLEQKEKLEAENKLLEERVRKLKIIAHNEQADVENLNMPGIRRLFLSITGKKQEKLEKEQMEARHAQQNLDAAAAKQDSTLHRLSQYAAELAALGNCEEELRQWLSLPEDAPLLSLEHCSTDLSGTQNLIDDLKKALVKVSQLGAIRNGTQNPIALAGTDDQLRSAERSAQDMLIQIKSELKSLDANLAAFGLKPDFDMMYNITDDYLKELYTYALITARVENVMVTLRQIGFQLDAIKPQLAQLTLDQQKKYLRMLLDIARSKSS